MLIVPSPKQIITKLRLLLALLLFVSVGCLPGPTDKVETPVPPLIGGETAAAAIPAQTTPTATIPATATLLPAEMSAPTAEPPAVTPPPAGDAIPGGPLYPVVDAELGYLLGGTHNGRWIDAHTYAAYLQDTERPYNIYTLAGARGVVTGSPPVAPGGICSQPLVTFNPSHDLAGAIALVATWDAAPRLAQPLPPDTAVYREVIAMLLQEQGVAEPEVQISSIQRVDLEGDGRDEVLIIASRLMAGTGAPPAAAGDYSLVVLRKVIDDTAVTTIPLALNVYPEAKDLAYPSQYRILGLLDLNGNGRLEIVVEADRYEGHLVTVYEVTPSGAQPVLQGGCAQ